MKNVLLNTILIAKIIELIAKEYKLSIEEVKNRFYNSEVINLLDYDKNDLYGSSALYLFSLYKLNIKKLVIKHIYQVII